MIRRLVVGRLVAAAAAGLLAALGAAGPAAAHAGEAPQGTDYRVTVTGVTPAVPGLTVRALEAGARMELVNRTGRTIVVLGYAGEPYLELRPDGVYQNTRSPATYLNRTLTGDTPVPGDADPALPPAWERISTGAVARWHEHRTHWMEPAPPAEVRADPSRVHRVRDWTVPLRDGTTVIEVRGTLDWVPPPSASVWWIGSLLGALLVGGLGLLSPEHRAGRAATVALAAGGAVAGLLAVLDAVGREVDAGATTPAALLVGLLTAQIWPLLAGLGALAAAGYALARRPATDFALALAGACLGIFAGAANGGVFARAVAPLPWSPSLARVATALVIAIGGGMALAGAFRMHAAARAVAAPPEPDEPAPKPTSRWRVDALP